MNRLHSTNVFYNPCELSFSSYLNKKGRAPRGSIKPLKYIYYCWKNILHFFNFSSLTLGKNKTRLTAQNNSYTHASTQTHAHTKQIFQPHISPKCKKFNGTDRNCNKNVQPSRHCLNAWLVISTNCQDIFNHFFSAESTTFLYMR